MHEQDPLGDEGAFVTVRHTKEAGFTQEERFVYVRKETRETWEALENAVNEGTNISLKGPPGTGKSTTAWAWACWKAKRFNKKVVWFHFTKKTRVKAVIDGTGNGHITGHTAEISDIKESDGHFLVVDGITRMDSVQIFQAATDWCKYSPDRNFVAVSSMSHKSAAQEDQEANLKTFTVGSWTFTQYEAACQDDAFFKGIKENLRCPETPRDQEEWKDPEDWLLCKYKYAGGCARWMFDFDYDTWLVDFNQHFRSVRGYKYLFGEEGGDQAEIAANHLRGLTVIDQKTQMPFFISQYTLNVLAAKCDNDKQFILDGYKKAEATQNPSFRGWIFEFDVDYQLQAASESSSLIPVVVRAPPQKKGETENWSVDRYVTFDAVSEVAKEMKDLEEGKVLWAKPKLWCQKAYDFLRFERISGERWKMLAVNATYAKNHSVLLPVINALGQELGKVWGCVVDQVRFDFLVPKELQEFKVGNVSGNLVGWKNFKCKAWALKLQPGELNFVVVTEIACTGS